MYPKKLDKSYRCLCDVLFCENCEIPVASPDITGKIRFETGIQIDIFDVANKAKAIKIKEKMYYRGKKKQQYRLVRGKYEVTRTASSSLGRSKNIVGIIGDGCACPTCLNKTKNDNILIPISDSSSVEIPCRYCCKCKKYYVSSGDFDIHLLKDNVYAEGYTYNGNALWNYTVKLKERKRREAEWQEYQERTKERLEKMSKIKSALIMICIKYNNEAEAEADYIITSKYSDCDCTETFHFCLPEAKELLSAAFAEQRNKVGKFGSHEYRVVDVLTYGKKGDSFLKSLIPIEVTIRADGGYASSVNADNELVSVFIYSLMTNRYEAIPATYNKTDGEYFMDISRFRTYIHAYGKPDIEVYFGRHSKGGFGNYYMNLKDESVLMAYGYCVNTNSNLSETKRQALLAELVDLEYLTVSKIVMLIETFIRLHRNCPNAIIKWKNDIEFIQNYKVNPERFSLCEKIKQK